MQVAVAKSYYFSEESTSFHICAHFAALSFQLTPVFFVFLFSSLSESFFMVKGAALFLQQGNSSQGQRSLQHPHKHAGNDSIPSGDLFSLPSKGTG